MNQLIYQKECKDLIDKIYSLTNEFKEKTGLTLEVIHLYTQSYYSVSRKTVGCEPGICSIHALKGNWDNFPEEQVYVISESGACLVITNNLTFKH